MPEPIKAETVVVKDVEDRPAASSPLDVMKVYAMKYKWNLGSLIAFTDGPRVLGIITSEDCAKFLNWARSHGLIIK